jgi:hypothetical protein
MNPASGTPKLRSGQPSADALLSVALGAARSRARSIPRRRSSPASGCLPPFARSVTTLGAAHAGRPNRARALPGGRTRPRVRCAACLCPSMLFEQPQLVHEVVVTPSPGAALPKGRVSSRSSRRRLGGAIWRRKRATLVASLTKASRRMRPPQLGQVSMSSAVRSRPIAC